jgi:transposase-like protein
MRLIAEGQSRAAVSRLTGIDTKTLGRYWAAYQAEGEKAFTQKRKHYSVRFKKTVLDDIEKKGQTVALVSAKYGVPAITIKRWMASKEKGGNAALKDGRRGNVGPYWQQVQYRAGQAVTLAMRTLSETQDGTMVREGLEKSKAFDNPLFGSFLINLYDIYSFLLLSDDGENKSPRELAYTSARIQLYAYPRTLDQHREIEELLELSETTTFISAYLNSIPKVMETYVNQGEGD